MNIVSLNAYRETVGTLHHPSPIRGAGVNQSRTICR